MHAVMLHKQRYFYTLQQAQTWRKYGDWLGDSVRKRPSVLFSGRRFTGIDQFELDMARFELREDGTVQPRELAAYRPALCCKLGNKRPGNLLKNIVQGDHLTN